MAEAEQLKTSWGYPCLLNDGQGPSPELLSEELFQERGKGGLERGSGNLTVHTGI